MLFNSGMWKNGSSLRGNMHTLMQKCGGLPGGDEDAAVALAATATIGRPLEPRGAAARATRGRKKEESAGEGE